MQTTDDSHLYPSIYLVSSLLIFNSARATDEMRLQILKQFISLRTFDYVIGV